MDVEQAKASSRPLEDYEIWERSPRGRADGIPDQPKIHRTMMTLPGDGDRIIERLYRAKYLLTRHALFKRSHSVDQEQ